MFDDVCSDLWIRYENVDACKQDEEKLTELLMDSDGKNGVVMFCKAEKQIKRLAQNMTVQINAELMNRLVETYGKENIAVVVPKIKWATVK